MDADPYQHDTVGGVMLESPILIAHQCSRWAPGLTPGVTPNMTIDQWVSFEH